MPDDAPSAAVSQRSTFSTNRGLPSGRGLAVSAHNRFTREIDGTTDPAIDVSGTWRIQCGAHGPAKGVFEQTYWAAIAQFRVLTREILDSR